MVPPTDPSAAASSHGVPRVFKIDNLVPRYNSPTSRSARLVNAETTGSKSMFSGIFWADPGSQAGWAFGPTDPKVKGCPHVGVGEEIYVCLAGRLSVEWSGGTFEFGAGDVVYFPDNNWYRTRVLSDVPVKMFYVMAPPPTSIWTVGKRVTQTGEPID